MTQPQPSVSEQLSQTTYDLQAALYRASLRDFTAKLPELGAAVAAALPELPGVVRTVGRNVGHMLNTLPDLSFALNALSRMAESESREARMVAAWATGEIGVDQPDNVTTIAFRLAKDDEPEVRDQVPAVYDEIIGPLQQRATIEIMRRWANDQDERVRRVVPLALIRRARRDPVPVLALLEELRRDSSLYVRRAVVNSLQQGWGKPDVLGPNAPTGPTQLVRLLREWARDSSPYNRWVVAYTVAHTWIERVPNGLSEALAILRFIAKDSTELVQKAVRSSLMGLRKLDEQPIIRAVYAWLRDDDPILQNFAQQWLAEFPSPEPEPLPNQQGSDEARPLESRPQPQQPQQPRQRQPQQPTQPTQQPRQQQPRQFNQPNGSNQSQQRQGQQPGQRQGQGQNQPGQQRQGQQPSQRQNQNQNQPGQQRQGQPNQRQNQQQGQQRQGQPPQTQSPRPPAEVQGGEQPRPSRREMRLEQRRQRVVQPQGQQEQPQPQGQPDTSGLVQLTPPNIQPQQPQPQPTNEGRRSPQISEAASEAVMQAARSHFAEAATQATEGQPAEQPRRRRPAQERGAVVSAEGNLSYEQPVTSQPMGAITPLNPVVEQSVNPQRIEQAAASDALMPARTRTRRPQVTEEAALDEVQAVADAKPKRTRKAATPALTAEAANAEAPADVPAEKPKRSRRKAADADTRSEDA